MTQVLKGLGIASAALLFAAGLLSLLGETTAAVAVASITAMLWILLVLVAVWGAGSWWTVRTMQAGADIALRAQQINDQWDTRKTSALAGVFNSGVKAAQQHQPASLPGDMPRLMPPLEEWLPPLESFSIDGDYSAVEDDE